MGVKLSQKHQLLVVAIEIVGNLTRVLPHRREKIHHMQKPQQNRSKNKLPT